MTAVLSADQRASFDRDGFLVLPDFVSAEDGTGIVHTAPAFGEDDMNVCNDNDIDLVIPVDMDGKFTSLVPEYEGQLVFDANKEIIRDLKAAGRVLRHQTIEPPTRTRGAPASR